MRNERAKRFSAPTSSGTGRSFIASLSSTFPSLSLQLQKHSLETHQPHRPGDHSSPSPSVALSLSVPHSCTDYLLRSRFPVYPHFQGSFGILCFPPTCEPLKTFCSSPHLFLEHFTHNPQRSHTELSQAFLTRPPALY